MVFCAPPPSIPTAIIPTSTPFHRAKTVTCAPLKLSSPCLKSSFHSPRCSVTVAAPSPTKPSPAEVSRTIMELSSVGTLSTLTREGWPLGTGVRFAVDPHGTPVLCLSSKTGELLVDEMSSLHVQLHQSGSRTPQCTLIGKLKKPEDKLLLKMFCEQWAKRFGEAIDETLIHVVAVERLLQMENFREDGSWVSSAEYVNANPDPLRNCAETIVNEMNVEHMEDIHRFCNIFVDLRFQVMEAKIVWIDRLGFDVHLTSTKNDVYEVRIPFSREVTDERGVKSTFNCMSQLAWEVEKNYTMPEFEKVKHLKVIK